MLIKITGYYEPEDSEADSSNPLGLTEEAYLRLIFGEDGRPLKLTQLSDVELEVSEP